MVPVHLAIIMDGNGRWAQARGQRRSMGHREGVRNIQRVIDFCIKQGVKVLSLYVFSTENRLRPKEEVDGLYNIARSYFSRIDEFRKQGIRVVISGSKSELPLDIVAKIDEVQKKTADEKTLTLNLCFNYGGQSEIVRAARLIAKSGKEVDEESFNDYLYNRLPPPDMIIRTGGHMRLSNFLLYQAAYAELYFTPVLWPDFGENDLISAFEEFGRRKRNFGKVDEA